MSTEYYTRRQQYTVPECPICSQSHSYNLEVSFIKKEPLILFGGKDSAETTKKRGMAKTAQIVRHVITFICSQTQKSFEHTVELEPRTNEEIHDISYDVSPPQHLERSLGSLSGTSVTEVMSTEVREWAKSSATTVREFSKTMLTTTTAAIPIYFAVLKYLGADASAHTLPAWVGIISPVLFLLSLASFVVVLRPHYGAIMDLQEFTQFRARRFHFMNVTMWIGTTLFMAGMLSAIVVYIWLLIV